ncbi:MAG: poly(beta-D-mannuronate) lyase [Stygiobacter sp.]|nr:MAG: poly(beta-D-mannuronate) lyase [Stygiobacter sp.]KAF0214196.1 MAG: poly(beta-D-mannuronate) [Ignavibacteria bacterium]
MKKIFALMILTIGIISAEEFKVSNAGEIKSVLKKIQPGDKVIMVNGEWKDASIIFDADGTKEKPITLCAETHGKVILNGNSTLKIAGDYLIVDGLNFQGGFIEKGAVIEFRNGTKKESNHSRLTNTVIENYNHPDKTVDYKWVSLYGSHNRVDHCYFRNKVHQGCLLVVWLSDKPNYHLIDSNYFAYRPDLRNNGGEIIRVGTSDWSMYPSYTVVEKNYFEQCNGEREIISNKSFYNTYRYNTFVECQGALTLRHGNNCEVYGNYFFGNNVKGTGGVRIIGEGHKVYNNYFQDLEGEDAFSALSIMNGVPNSPLNRYYQVKNAIVAFNTFVNNRHSIEIGIGKNEELSLPPINCTIANNIVYSTKGKLVKYVDEPQNFKWEGNVFFGSELGISNPGGVEIKDPQMKKVDGLFRPQNLEVIQNNSVGNYEFVVEDINGQKRKLQKTIGCAEIDASKGIHLPINKNNTGPSWLRND